MKAIALRPWKTILLTSCALYLSGCGTTPQEELLKKWIAHIEESRGILAKVTDEASAKSALADLTKSIETFDQAVSATKLDKAEGERLGRKYGDEFEKAGNRFRGERDRIKTRHPEAWNLLEPTASKVKGVMSPAERVLGR